VFLPALRACTGRILPDATPAFAYVSHADHSTIGSNFCQGQVAENAECILLRRAYGGQEMKSVQPQEPRLTRWIEISPEWHDSEPLEDKKDTL
jgi:hypothetical protein